MAGVRGGARLWGALVARHCSSAARLGSTKPPMNAVTRYTSSVTPSPTRGLSVPLGVLGIPHRQSGVRRVHSDISVVPQLSDPQAKEALNALLATNWSHIDKDVFDTVGSALSKGGGDSKILAPVWSSAVACERFADILVALRYELDELSGSGGESVGRLPDTVVRALESAYTKYMTYLESFGEDEDFLKKKVENDLGGLLIQIKQRCSGLDPKWAKITLLGTSGLAGSYIDRRHVA